MPYAEKGYGVSGYGTTFDFLYPTGDVAFKVMCDEKLNLFKVMGVPE